MRSLVWQRLIGVSIVLLACTATHVAWGQTAGGKVAAEALFQEGKRLLEANQAEAACPKFEESQRLDPAPGTLLWLADCYETSGRTATAWATFHSAAASARVAGQSTREQIAEHKAAALEPKLSRLTIAIPELPASDRFEVRRDGVVVGQPEWGTAIPVDPGEHVIAASAPGFVAWTKHVQVLAAATTLNVVIPRLERETSATVAAASSPVPVAESPAPAPPDRDVPATPADRGKTQRTLAYAAGGIGIVGLAVGAVFGLQRNAKQADAKPHCDSYPNGCDSDGLSLNEDARSAGTIATIGFIAGGVALAGGVVLYATAPTDRPEEPRARTVIRLVPRVGTNQSELVIRGAW